MLDNEYLRFEMTGNCCRVSEICEREGETPKNASVICKVNWRISYELYAYELRTAEKLRGGMAELSGIE